MINEKEIGKNIADNFEKILIDKKMTIPDVARKMYLTRYSVNLFLKNLRGGKGTFKTVCKYANALGINPYELFYESKLVPREPKCRREI